MKIRLFFAVFLVAATLCACDSHQTGNTRLSPAVVSTIRKGVTTKDQVRALLGAPQSVTTQVPIPQPPVTTLPVKYAAAETWAFWSTRTERSWLRLPFISPAAAQQTTFSTIIFFDTQGVVLDCQTELTRL